jgi:hypothetical protein
MIPGLMLWQMGLGLFFFGLAFMVHSFGVVDALMESDLEGDWRRLRELLAYSVMVPSTLALSIYIPAWLLLGRFIGNPADVVIRQ